ncbi:MAG: hypothetical protein ACTHLR_03195 [Rhizomicrobium sp.]
MKPESVSSNAKPAVASANDPQKSGNEKAAQGGQTPESKTEEKSAPEAGSNNS